MIAPRSGHGQREPWFQQHPWLAVGTAVLIYAAVFVLGSAVEGAGEAIAILYVLPVALLASAFGFRSGLLAGVAGVFLFAEWALSADASISLLQWVARAAPILLLGGLVGSAVERQREAAEVRRWLLEAELREREAAEINDCIIQGLAVAKWSLEAGNRERSLEALTGIIETAQALVSDLLSGRPIRPGTDPSGKAAVASDA